MSNRLAVYENGFRRAIIEPLLQRVDSDCDPIRKLLHLQVAEVAENLKATNPLLQQARAAAAGFAAGSGSTKVEDMQLRLAQARQILALARELMM
jgi:hypothetical protein